LFAHYDYLSLEHFLSHRHMHKCGQQICWQSEVILKHVT
jgi:hypothetical protein